MEVGVDEAGRDGHAAGVDDLGAGPGQVADVIAASDRDEARVLDREGLGLREIVVHGVHPPSDQNHVRSDVAGFLETDPRPCARVLRVRPAQLEVADSEAGGQSGADS